MVIFVKQNSIWLFFLLLVVTLYLQLTPVNLGIQNVSAGKVTFRFDYIEHFLNFAILGFFYLIWRLEIDPSKWFTAFKISFTIFFIGLFLEFAQLIIPGRTYNYFDLIANGAGSISSALFWTLFVRLKR